MTMVRFADMQDMESINALRREVYDLHVQGRPDMFKPGFGEDVKNHVIPYLRSEGGYAALDERDGRAAGMVMVDYIDRPESPYSPARKFVHVAEICVCASFRRQGVGKALMDIVKADAREKGYARIDLDVWAFNDALAFYEAQGFTVFRRFLEINL